MKFDMMQRIVTSVIGLILFFAVFFASEAVFAAAVALLIFMAVYEMNKAISPGGFTDAVNYCIAALLFFASRAQQAVAPAVLLTIMIYMIISVFLYPKHSFKVVYSSAFAVLFVTLFFSSLMKIRAQFGEEAVFLVFLFSWITDTGAYFSGRFFGKHKLIPKVSPKKTVEGAVGGVLSTVVATCIYLAILKHCFGINDIAGSEYAGVSLLAVFSSVMAQFGDLAASVIKRECKIKDFGTLLPGHGGIMDRFDSVVFISPIVLLYFSYL